MEGRDLPAWSVRLREERTRRLWSQKGMAVRLRDAADAHTRHSLPPAESIQRYVRSYESGRHLPGDLYAELYCRAFGLTREALFGSSRHSGVSPSPSEHDATSLSAWIADEQHQRRGDQRTWMRLGPRWPRRIHGCRRGRFWLMSPRFTGRSRRCCAADGSARGRLVSCSASTRTCWPMPACCSMTSSHDATARAHGSGRDPVRRGSRVQPCLRAQRPGQDRPVAGCPAWSTGGGAALHAIG